MSVGKIIPIDPSRACTECGVMVVEWDPDGDTPETNGCLWPDGKRGCWSGFDEHICRSCGEAMGLPEQDRTCPRCKVPFANSDEVAEHFGGCQ